MDSWMTGQIKALDWRQFCEDVAVERKNDSPIDTINATAQLSIRIYDSLVIIFLLLPVFLLPWPRVVQVGQVHTVEDLIKISTLCLIYLLQSRFGFNWLLQGIPLLSYLDLARSTFIFLTFMLLFARR